MTGARTRAIYQALEIDPIERSAWLGAAFLLTLLLARRWSRSLPARRLAGAAGIFFVLALGPWLTVAGQQTGMLLPGMAVRWIPILNNARIPGRAIVIVYLVMALLVAVGLARRARGVTLPLVASLLVAADYIAVPLPLDRIVVPRLYDTIAQIPGAVLELPFGFRDGFGEHGRFDSQVLLDQTVHGRPILGGFVARLSPVLRDRYLADPIVRSLLTASAGKRVPAARMTSDSRVAHEMLSRFGVTTVILNRGTAPAALIEYVERVLPIVPTAHEGQLTAYAVR